MDMLINSSSHVFNNTNLELVARDQNGVYTYKLKYIISSTQTVELPFALCYCGAHVPSGLECRQAIKEYLQNSTGANDEVLEAVFPDLFVSARFYVVPLWDMYTQLTEREVYNSVNNFYGILTRAKQIFPEVDETFLEDHLELLTNGQNKMLSLVLPDELNTDYFSVLEQHPTYQDYTSSSQVAGWKYMTAATQEFASKLISCMSVLTGNSTSSAFVEANENDFTYLTFTSGASEYYVMEKDSYQNYLASL